MPARKNKCQQNKVLFLFQRRPNIIVLLEGEFRTELNNSSWLRAEDFPGSGGPYACIRRVEVDKIENIKKFCAEFSVNSFGDG